MASAAGGRLAACALLAALASAQHGGGTNMPGGGIDLGALLGGGGGGGGGKKQEVCKKGQVMVPKTEYKPAANGCGPTGMRQREGDQWGLHECCNGHDTCYVRSCGSRAPHASADTPWTLCGRRHAACRTSSARVTSRSACTT